jgi:hypothetical protein
MHPPELRADTDMDLVARIIRAAGVPCVLDIGRGTSTIWAEPRPAHASPTSGNGTAWTVQVVQRRSGSAEEIWVGPARGGRPTVRVRPGSDERELAALVVAQALRVDPCLPLSPEEADAAGLGRSIFHV